MNAHAKNTVTGVDDADAQEFAKRVLAIKGEIKDRNEDLKAIYAEMRGKGHDVKAFKAALAELEKDPDKVAEFATLVDLYKAAIGGVVL